MLFLEKHSQSILVVVFQITRSANVKVRILFRGLLDKQRSSFSTSCNLKCLVDLKNRKCLVVCHFASNSIFPCRPADQLNHYFRHSIDKRSIKEQTEFSVTRRLYQLKAKNWQRKVKSMILPTCTYIFVYHRQ